MAVTLKEKHSLMGKSIVPILMELKSAPMPAQLARLKKDHPLEHYKLEEMQLEFKKLTGEDLNNVLTLAGKQTNIENAIHALHLAILQANNVGAPKGTLLRETQEPTQPAVRTSSSPVQPPETLESRMRKLEENLATQHKQSVDDALRNVRTLAARPKLVSPGVLIAALEALVDSACVGNHPDQDFFKKSLIACRQYEEHPDLCALCLKLLGSSDDRKIASSVAEWMKSCSKKDSMKERDSREEKEKSVNFVPYSPLAPQGYPLYSPPFLPFGSPMAPPPGPGYFGNANKYTGGQKTPSKKKGPCFYCKEPGHVVRDCPKFSGKKD